MVESTAVIVMPTSSRRFAGPVATWVTAAGWAQAAREQFGSAIMITPEGRLTPEEALAMVSRPVAQGSGSRNWRRRLPMTLLTARSDLRSVYRGMRFLPNGFSSLGNVRLVWQHHELFQHAGAILARRCGVPLVQFVDAPVVWEARKWGVKRPWGRLLEWTGERPQLRYPDVIACVSDEVALACVELGAPRERVLTTPCAVDAERFRATAEDRSEVRARYGLGTGPGDFTVGWMGGFRRFHGLGLLLEAAALLKSRGQEPAILLVGDGLERANLESHAQQLGLERVIFTGMVSQSDIPAYIAAMDVAVVTAPETAASSFHYSPLKLKEYMAAGKAIIAPGVGEIPAVLDHGRRGTIVDPGDREALADAIAQLRDDLALGQRLGQSARTAIETTGSWRYQLERVIAVLRDRGWEL